jgi:hypothetical protein
MGIKEDVDKAIEAFEKANPTLKGKVRITDMDRTWEEQLGFILSRRTSYPNITANFSKQFPDTKTKWPTKASQLSKEQLAWWKTEIMKQAGKSPGFPHVGGKAIDVSVKNLNNDGKKLLKDEMDKLAVKVLMEHVTGDDAEYGVSISKATVFHCTN